ncbi:MAG: VCBS repeat-containing protein [Verrucomicrobia bacterium]|nr:VCBS repeat-containing protein [Verrucomicrobiota bacterium]
MSRNRCMTTLVVTVATALLAATAARAMINPSFTPVQLVNQAGLILWVDIKPGESQDQYTATIRETLKGEEEQKPFRLDISEAGDDDAAAFLRELLAAGKPALFFVGELEDTKDLGGGNTRRRAFLHLGGAWAVFDFGEDGLWSLSNLNDRMLLTVWHGGTDMLRRAVEYILTDEDPVLPVAEGFSFSKEPLKLASVEGTINAVRTVDLAGDGKLALFVACESGDRLFDGAEARTFTDLTAARGLQSKSRAYAWGDFAGQGRLDLISFDGKVVSLHAQQADGKFQVKPLDLGGAVTTGCVALAALDVGATGRSGLLVSGDAWPVLVVLDAEGKATATALAAPGVEPAKLGKPGPCLVADFDGDGLPDVLMPAEKGSVWFRATAAGKFAPGVDCAVQLGKSPSAACLTDFDADGRLDVFCANRSGSYLWENAGDGMFVETFEETGELSYGASRRGIDCMAGDLNNDGRQDVMIAYSANKPMFFFNRGFRSFGNAAGVNMGFEELLPAAIEGQTSACLADLDGDGAQDLALALSSGEIWVAFQENSDADWAAMMVAAVLPVSGPCKGPVAVTGWIGKRCLGAWNVLPGVSQACFGRTEAGPVTLKWRLPGGQEQSREVILEQGGTVRVEIK